MNCDDVRNDLEEYLDGTLDADRTAAVRSHLQFCPACARALQRERARGPALRTRLRPAVERLTMDRRLAVRILDAARPAPRWPERVGSAWARHRIPLLAAGGASLLAAAALLLRGPWTAPAARSDAPPAVVSVDVSYETHVRVLQIRDGMMVDGIVTRVVECDGTL